jgi:hypothetical protein
MRIVVQYIYIVYKNVRKDIDVNENEIIFNFRLRHKLK